MDFEQALVYELSMISGLTNKIFPQNAEENVEPPLVVYMSSGGEKIMTLSGPTQLTELNCELHLICETYEQLKGYTKAVLARVQSFFQRNIGNDGPYIKSVSYIEPVEDIENQLNYHRSQIDIKVRF